MGRKLAAGAAIVGLALLGSACGDDDTTRSATIGNKLGAQKAFVAGVDASQLDDLDVDDLPDEPDIPEEDLIDASVVDPCLALTATDLAVLGVSDVPAEQVADEEGAHCGWAGEVNRVLVALGAGDFAEVESGLDLGPATPTTFQGLESARVETLEACGLLFHATNDSTLAVIASNTDGLCGLVEQAASLVLANVG